MKRVVGLLIWALLLILAHPVLGASIHVEWEFTLISDGVAGSGFKLYQEGVSVCQTIDPQKREMDCYVTLPASIISYTLTATFVDGTESPHSIPYQFVTRKKRFRGDSGNLIRFNIQ